MVHVLVFAQYSTSGITAGLELLHGQLLALGGDSYLAWGGCLGHGPAKKGCVDGWEQTQGRAVQPGRRAEEARSCAWAAEWREGLKP
jgi:hypothetical protein